MVEVPWKKLFPWLSLKSIKSSKYSNKKWKGKVECAVQQFSDFSSQYFRWFRRIKPRVDWFGGHVPKLLNVNKTFLS